MPRRRLSAVTELKILVEHFAHLLERAGHDWTKRQLESWSRLRSSLERLSALIVAENRIYPAQAAQPRAKRADVGARAQPRAKLQPRARQSAVKAAQIQRTRSKGGA